MLHSALFSILLLPIPSHSPSLSRRFQSSIRGPASYPKWTKGVPVDRFLSALGKPHPHTHTHTTHHTHHDAHTYAQTHTHTPHTYTHRTHIHTPHTHTHTTHTYTHTHTLTLILAFHRMVLEDLGPSMGL